MCDLHTGPDVMCDLHTGPDVMCNLYTGPDVICYLYTGPDVMCNLYTGPDVMCGLYTEPDVMACPVCNVPACLHNDKINATYPVVPPMVLPTLWCYLPYATTLPMQCDFAITYQLFCYYCCSDSSQLTKWYKVTESSSNIKYEMIFVLQ